jgi:DNA-directed RNA polymerase specialized sigma24 family protein
MAARPSKNDNLSQQRFLRLFLASKPEVRRYVAVLVTNMDDAQEVIQERAGVERLAAEWGRSVDAVYKALRRVRHALQACMEQAVREEAAT